MLSIKNLISNSTKLSAKLAWTGWLLAIFFVVYKFLTQVNYSILNDGIADSLSLSLTQVGLLGAVYTYGFAAMTIPSGALLDYYGARKILTIGVGIVAIGAYIFAIAKSWEMIVLGQLLMGIGGAFGYPGAGYVTRHYFDIRYFGIMFGFVQTIAAASTSIGQSATGYMLINYSWREIMLVSAGIGLFLMLIISLVIRDPHVENNSNKKFTENRENSFWHDFYVSLKEIVTSKLLWGAALASSAVFASYLGIGVIWGVKILTARGFDLATASNVNATIWVGAAFGGPLVAFLANAVRSYKIAAIVYICGMLIPLLMLVFFTNTPPELAYPQFFAIGFFGSGSSVLAFTFGVQVCKEKTAGTTIAFINFTKFIIAGLMMPIPGKLLAFFSAITLPQATLVFPSSLLVTLFCLTFFYKEKDILPISNANK